MPLKESLKEEGQKEREKLKNMSSEDKVWYIWEYYKIHIFIVIGLCLVLYLIGNILYQKTFTSRLSYAVINDLRQEESSFEEFNEEFKSYMGYGKKDLISSDGSIVIQYKERMSELEYGNMVKLSALIAAQDLDIIIADQLNIDHYVQLDGFKNLREVLPEDLWQQVEPYVYYGENEAGEDIPCAIDIHGSFFCEKTGVAMEPCYFAVVSNTARIDTVISWLRFALGAG